jgi:hypothetical protein
MTDRDDRIREAFDGGAPTLERERVWARVLQARARSVRRRLAARVGFVLATVSVVAGVVALRDADLRSGLLSRFGPAPVPAHLDSIDLSPQPEASVIVQQEAPSSLIPLLGYRINLRRDIQELEGRIGEIRSMIESNPSDARTGELTRDLHVTSEQLQSAVIALRAVDRQIAGLEGTPMPALPPIPEIVTDAEEPTTLGEGIEVPPPIYPEGIPVERVALLGGLGLTLLLAFVMTVMYVRRSVRAGVRSVSDVQSQIAAQHATLAAGIDAIALEVERLGEGQRYMSKVIAGGAEGRDVPSHLRNPER